MEGSVEELTEEPTEELAEEPVVGATTGPADETTVECPTSGQGSPLRSVQETEERVVIHVSEEEIEYLC